MRILTAAVLVSIVLAIAGPHARTAIAALHGEFAALDTMAVPAAPPQARRQPHWVTVSDHTAALAREQARQRATGVRP